jgi:cyclopropane fatty-acyl-phospholipid synthase-like methyltransferase
MMKLHATVPKALKRVAWNLKYGILKYPQLSAPEDTLRYLRGRLCQSSSVLELGCGRGSLLRGLRNKGWNGHYCGVDISKRALEDAQKVTDQRSSWVVSDMESFGSPFQWDAIVMVESVYYIHMRELPTFLNRLHGLLSRSGFMLVRIHDFEEHADYVDLMCSLFPHTKRVDQTLLCLL